MKYIGVKIINARRMDKGEAWNRDLVRVPLEEGESLTGEAMEELYNTDGYEVTYEDGYISWSPKDVFDKAYRLTDGMTFGLAVEALRKGLCISRKGWNGKGLFVCKQVPAIIDVETIVPKMQSLPQSAKDQFAKRFELIEEGTANVLYKSINYQNQMIIVKPDNTIDSWVPSGSDVFAEDWQVIE